MLKLFNISARIFYFWIMFATLQANVIAQDLVGNWTWLSGTDKVNEFGVYGAKGVASSENHLGARFGHSMVIDPAGKLVYVHGGYGNAVGVDGYMNDLWMFNASSGWWTWIGGATSVNQMAFYGTKGSSSGSTRPGARVYHSMVMDSSGQYLYVFGGWAYGESSDGNVNDLWRFDVISGLWTWISGAKTLSQVGIYGTKGSPSGSTRPGARWYHSMAIDTSKKFIYVFGGNGFAATSTPGNLNDLWKFDLSSGLWTWLSGANAIDQTAIYESKGVASPDNRPGARFAQSMVIDPSGTLLYVFGGSGTDTGPSGGLLNDIWLFNISSGDWTWLSGSNAANELPFYGTKGKAATENRPGARSYSSMVMDLSGKLLYVHGGLGYGTNANDYLNDMWLYNVTSGLWTWLSGANAINQVGTYGIKGEASMKNWPGARYAHSMVLDPSQKTLILFGGWGYDASSDGWLNDMWTLPLNPTQQTMPDQSPCNTGFYRPNLDLGTCIPLPAVTSDMATPTHVNLNPSSIIPPNSASSKTIISVQTNPRSRLINRRDGNFWLDNMYLALIFIAVMLISIFELGCCLGMLYEKRKNQKLQCKFGDLEALTMMSFRSTTSASTCASMDTGKENQVFINSSFDGKSFETNVSDATSHTMQSSPANVTVSEISGGQVGKSNSALIKIDSKPHSIHASSANPQTDKSVFNHSPNIEKPLPDIVSIWH